jgi:murein L,D-transpeptidase YcbB/YkuD
MSFNFTEYSKRVKDATTVKNPVDYAQMQQQIAGKTAASNNAAAAQQGESMRSQASAAGMSQQDPAWQAWARRVESQRQGANAAGERDASIAALDAQRADNRWAESLRSQGELQIANAGYEAWLKQQEKRANAPVDPTAALMRAAQEPSQSVAYWQRTFGQPVTGRGSYISNGPQGFM